MTRLVSYFRHNRFVAFECVRFLTTAVHGDDFMSPRSRESSQVAGMLRVGRVGHRTCQRIGREEIPSCILGLQLDMPCR